MYFLKTEHSFDSAHFLSGYEGKCRYIHGHEWRVEIEICSEVLTTEGPTRDMLFDFGQLKKDVRFECDTLDHALLVEEGSLKETTIAALNDEDFKIIFLPFRPTAERLAKYFYERMGAYGYHVKRATVYETPVNCAAYEA